MKRRGKCGTRIADCGMESDTEIPEAPMDSSRRDAAIVAQHFSAGKAHDKNVLVLEGR
jgi:hypothetical protein